MKRAGKATNDRHSCENERHSYHIGDEREGIGEQKMPKNRFGTVFIGQIAQIRNYFM